MLFSIRSPVPRTNTLIMFWNFCHLCKSLGCLFLSSPSTQPMSLNCARSSNPLPLMHYYANSEWFFQRCLPFYWCIQLLPSTEPLPEYVLNILDNTVKIPGWRKKLLLFQISNKLIHICIHTCKYLYMIAAAECFPKWVSVEMFSQEVCVHIHMRARG